MPIPPTAGSSLADRVRSDLRVIKDQVAGVHGSLVATSDGFPVAHDVPEIEPAQIAALVASIRTLATSMMLATGRGEFTEALARGSLGCLAVYAAGDAAIVVVIGNNELNLGMLRARVGEVAGRVAAYAPELGRWGASGNAGTWASQASSGPGAGPGALPTRRSGAS